MTTVALGCEVTVDLDVQSVWNKMKDFGNTKWIHGEAVKNTIIEGKGVGAIRTLTFPKEMGGLMLTEKLIACNDEQHTYSYAVQKVFTYPSTFIGTVYVDELNGKTRIRYVCSETVDEKKKEETEKMNAGIVGLHKKAFLSLKK